MSSGCRFVAEDMKATKRPSAEIAGSVEPSLPLAPVAPLARLTSVVVFVCRSRTNTSTRARPSSSGWRFVAVESKATKRPSAEIARTRNESSFPLAPAAPDARLTRSRSSFAAHAAAASAASATARQQASTLAGRSQRGLGPPSSLRVTVSVSSAGPRPR